jgi:hypothetical protein
MQNSGTYVIFLKPAAGPASTLTKERALVSQQCYNEIVQSDAPHTMLPRLDLRKKEKENQQQQENRTRYCQVTKP